MAKKQTKLELTWIGKTQRPKLDPLILIKDPDLPLFPAAIQERVFTLHVCCEG